jgi:hypothetical protein
LTAKLSTILSHLYCLNGLVGNSPAPGHEEFIHPGEGDGPGGAEPGTLGLSAAKIAFEGDLLLLVETDLRAGDKASSTSCAEGLIDRQSACHPVGLDGIAGAGGLAFGLAALGAYRRVALTQRFVFYDPHPG